MDQRFLAVVSAVGLLAAFSWFVVTAPPLLSFTAAAAIGTGWCRWLEAHPNA